MADSKTPEYPSSIAIKTVRTGIKTSIFVTTSFEGFHCYPDAPEEVAFLRAIHRHLFHVRAELEVSHGNRELEFFLVKRALESYIYDRQLGGNLNHKSCEMIAKELLEFLLASYGLSRNMSVEVSEDGENGSIVRYNSNLL